MVVNLSSIWYIAIFCVVACNPTSAQDGKLQVIGYNKGMSKNFGNICLSPDLNRVALEFESPDSFEIQELRFFTGKVYNQGGSVYFYISNPPNFEGIAVPVALIDTLGNISPEAEVIIRPDSAIMLEPGRYWAVLDFSQADGANSSGCFCRLLTGEFKETRSITYVQVLKPDDRSLTKSEEWLPMSEYQIVYRVGNLNHSKIKHRLYRHPLIEITLKTPN